jgi:heterodisulfide reductase subunit C
MTRGEQQAAMVAEISGCDPFKCMKCGKCSASCPAYDQMDIKPHQFASYIIAGDLENLVESKAAFKCMSCFACIERCPRGVEPGKLVDAARQLMTRERGGDYMQPEEVPELLAEDLPQQLLVSAFRRYRR